MSDKFARLEYGPRVGAAFGVLVVLALIGIFFSLMRWPSGAPRQVTGTVQASGAISAERVAGGTREAASVRLESGNLIMAQVAEGGPLAPGDKVRLVEQSRLLGGPVYQVVAKVAGH